MQATFKNVVEDLEKFCDNHNQIKEFGCGEQYEISTKDHDFVMVYAEPVDSLNNGTEFILSFELYVFDLLKQDMSNKVDVWSDTLLIGNDIISNFFDDEDTYDWTLNETNVPCRPFIREFDDFTGGWRFEVDISILNTLNTCQIPQNLT